MKALAFILLTLSLSSFAQGASESFFNSFNCYDKCVFPEVDTLSSSPVKTFDFELQKDSQSMTLVFRSMHLATEIKWKFEVRFRGDIIENGQKVGQINNNFEFSLNANHLVCKHALATKQPEDGTYSRLDCSIWIQDRWLPLSGQLVM